MSQQKSGFIRVFFPIISLIITFGLLYDLVSGVERITGGDRSSGTILRLLFESIMLFIVPFAFNPKYYQSTRKPKVVPQEQIDKDKERKRWRLRKQISFKGHYEPPIIMRCPKCKFENPPKTNVCFNCGEKLVF
jgi:hypothetical protein